MRTRLHNDLDRWETGQLSLAELMARNPDLDLAELVSLYGYLTSLRTEPTPPPAADHIVPPRAPRTLPGARRRRHVHRPIIIAATVTMLSAGAALALEPVRRVAVDIFRDAARAVAHSGARVVLALSSEAVPLPTAGAVHIAGREDLALGWRPEVRVSEGDPITCLIVDRPAHGLAAVDSGCSKGSYLPRGDFHGTDTFRYIVRGEDGISIAAPVTVTVLPVNDPPVAADDTATTDEDAQVVIPTLVNDADPDGDSLMPLRDDLHEVPSHGNLVVRSVVGALGDVESSGGRVSYTPASNFSGTDVFRYKVWDGNNGFDTASVKVAVKPLNDPPTTQAIVVSGTEDDTLTWRPRVEDVDGDALSCSIDETLPHGQASVLPDCTEGTFTPDPDFHGRQTVPISITDGALSVKEMVTFAVEEVNDPPRVEDGSILAREDESVLWTPEADDVDEDGLDCTILDPPLHGEVSVEPDCTSGTFVPDPNFHGDDLFSYTVSDGVAIDLERAKVTVTTLSVNDAPTAGPDSATTEQDVSVIIPVLANDGDAEGQQLRLVAVDGPSSGGAIANADGTVTYTPNLGFVGTDTFSYAVSDAEGAVTLGHVVIAVIPSPVAERRTSGGSGPATT